MTILYLDFGDCKPFETIWHQVLCPLVTAISNVGHKILAFELPPHSVVYSLWFTPVGLHEKNLPVNFTVKKISVWTKTQVEINKALFISKLFYAEHKRISLLTKKQTDKIADRNFETLKQTLHKQKRWFSEWADIPNWHYNPQLHINVNYINTNEILGEHLCLSSLSKISKKQTNKN